MSLQGKAYSPDHLRSRPDVSSEIAGFHSSGGNAAEKKNFVYKCLRAARAGMRACLQAAEDLRFPSFRAMVPITALSLMSFPGTLKAQVKQNVVVFEVTEPGFITDGPSIFNATFTSSLGTPLIVEPVSVPGNYGPLSRYYVHGLNDENVTVTAPGHESKVVSTMNTNFVDIWLKSTSSVPRPTSSRYWYGPTAPSLTAPTAAAFRGSSDLFFASSAYGSNQLVISRMDKPPLLTGQTSPTGASLAAFSNRLWMAWQGTGNRYLNIMSSADGVSWGGKFTLRETSPARPSITAYNDQLVLSWIGTDHHINLLFSSDGVNWGNKQTLPDQSGTSPALLSIDSSLYLSWMGYLNQTLNLAVWNGSSWMKTGTADTSESAPSLSIVTGTLNVSWTGKGNHLVNSMTIDTDAFSFLNKTTFALTSDKTPTVISYNWPNATNSKPLPLFLYSSGQTNVAGRYWSDINAQPLVETTGIVHPRYAVVSVIYSPPGTAAAVGAAAANNSVSYDVGTQLGTSVSASNSFKYGNELDVSASFGPASVGTNLGATISVKNESSNDIRIGYTTTDTYYGPAADTINHDLDKIVIFLNPEVTLGTTAVGPEWSLGATNGIALTQDLVVGWLKSPATIPMPASVAATLNSAGIYPSDYADILAHDPFIGSTPGAVLTTSRFVRETTVPYETLPTEDSHIFKFSSSNAKTETTTSDDSYSVSLVAGVSSGPIGASLKDTSTWTWDNQTAVSNSETDVQNATATIYGPSAAFTGASIVEVYWDTIYRTFAFAFEGEVPEPGEVANGVLLNAAGTPLSHAQVDIQDASGKRYSAITNSHGVFSFFGVQSGSAQLTTGAGIRKQIEVGNVSNYQVLQQ